MNERMFINFDMFVCDVYQWNVLGTEEHEKNHTRVNEEQKK